MNDIEICKKCIYYEPALFCNCQLIGQLCINNCEFLNAEMVINNYIERTERESSCDIATNKINGTR